jgi:hypothetical protein
MAQRLNLYRLLLANTEGEEAGHYPLLGFPGRWPRGWLGQTMTILKFNKRILLLSKYSPYPSSLSSTNQYT